MAESSAAAGNRLGGGLNDFQKTGDNNWNFPTTIRSDHSGSNKDSVSEYSDVSEEEERLSGFRDKGKGSARSESRSRS